MLIILGFCSLYHKLQFCFVCHAHYTPFTCDKGLLKLKIKKKSTLNFKEFQIPYLLKSECFSNANNKFISYNFFYRQKIYVTKRVLYLILCKINQI